MKKAAARQNLTQAREALAQAGQLDRMIKGLAGGDIWNEFLRLGLKLATPTRQPQ
jgi:DNA polymerase-3 subunit delta